MNNLDKVFSSIKKHCGKATRMAEINCFDDIANDAGINKAKLAVYLDHLQELDLIKYSIDEGYIYLTALGRRQEASKKEEVK